MVRPEEAASASRRGAVKGSKRERPLPFFKAAFTSVGGASSACSSGASSLSTVTGTWCSPERGVSRNFSSIERMTVRWLDTSSSSSQHSDASHNDDSMDGPSTADSSMSSDSFIIISSSSSSDSESDGSTGAGGLWTVRGGSSSPVPYTQQQQYHDEAEEEEAAAVDDSSLLSPGADPAVDSESSQHEEEELQPQPMDQQLPPPPPAPAGLLPVSGGDARLAGWQVGRRYQLRALLGAGAYGQVAEAWDQQAQRLVAIKRIVEPCGSRRDALCTYRELALLRRLRGHPNVVELLDVVLVEGGEGDGDDLYLVFEHAETDLYKLTRSEQHLSDAHVRLFLYQALLGLQHLHAAGIVHRDLKPANMLVNANCSLKIADLGLACRLALNTDHHDHPAPAAAAAGGALPVAAARQAAVSSKNNDGMQEGPGNRHVSSIDNRHRSAGHHHHQQQQQQQQQQCGEEQPPGGLQALLPKFLPVLTRQLTGHVTTRWYRAPEVILREAYGRAVDVWSLGCVLAELLGMQQPATPAKARAPLLPGASCFPLSPKNGKQQQQQQPGASWSDSWVERDQLGLILRVLGTPDPQALQRAFHPSRVDYVSRAFPPSAGTPLRGLYPCADPRALDLLARMLAFVPDQRISVPEALAHPYFRELYDPRNRPIYGVLFANNYHNNSSSKPAAGGGRGGGSCWSWSDMAGCGAWSREQLKARIRTEARDFQQQQRQQAQAVAAGGRR